MSFGVYIHVPFCEQHCHYCAFPVAVLGTNAHAPYVDRLLREIDLAELPDRVGTVYLGGGTPSLLSPSLLDRLFAAIPKGAREVSIEVNPGTFDEERIGAYLGAGVTRVSLGVQSFDQGDLRNAGRLHGPEDSSADYETLRRHGFDDINMDLIAGLPGQTHESWEINLDRVIELGPEHLSIYLLDVEDSSLWGRQATGPPNDEDAAWFYVEAAQRLDGAGYRHYEISSWARPGRECRHNLGYWNGVPYRGVGLGAHSFIGGRRFWNTRSLDKYARMLDDGTLPIEEIEERTRKIRLQEAFMLGLRQIDGFDVAVVAKDLGIDYPQDWFDRVENLARDGLVTFDGRTLKLTPSGWLFATGITEELLCPTLLLTSEATP